MDGAGIEKQGQKEGVSPTSPHLIEQIALFREGFEREIYTGIPPTQWMDTYSANLVRQPASVQALKPQFDVVLDRLVQTRSELDDFWKANVVEPVEEDGYEFSNPTESARLFQLIYGFAPSAPVDAVRGIIDLDFYVGKNDLDRITGKTPLTDEVSGLVNPNFALFPVVVIDRDRDNEEIWETLAHELRHVQDVFTVRATDSLDKATNFLPQQFDMLGGEILAEFTPIIGGKEDLLLKKDSAISFFKDGFPQYVNEWGEYVYRHVKNNNGSYYQGGNEKVLKDGVDAMVGLIAWYEERFPDYNSVRIASNVLSQFPVERWKAVVRLLKKGNNNSSQQSV